MQKLKIGQIAPLNLPVPPKKYGGSEKIIDFLCQGLTKKGHQVFLFGTGDSNVPCPVIEVVNKGLWSEKHHKESGPYYGYQMAMVAQKAQELKLDIIHDHLGPVSLALYSHQLKNKIIHTLHIPLHSQDRIWAYQKLNSQLVSISNNQRKPAPALNYLATIYNGLDVENYPLGLKPKDYFCWVGELSPRKGILEVIKIAKMAKVKLVIAGRIPPETQKNDFAFYKKYVSRLLNKGNIKYVGEKTPLQLKQIYKNAIAFLNPLQWEEPFGLTTIEAMACGTPVMALRRGAMPEIINGNKTGLLVATSPNKEKELKQFAEKIKNVADISRAECRKWVENNFSSQKMVNEYEKLFYKLAKHDYISASHSGHCAKN